MAKTRWGIIGASGWADHTFGPAIEKARGAQFAAVLSSDNRRAAAYARKHGCARAYDDLKAFASDPEIDAVWIASPTNLHARHAIACLAAGKHVLCEKPMAIRAAECVTMIAAAKKAKRLLSIDFQMRHVPQHAEAARLASSGALGKIAMVHTHFFYPYGAPPASWRQSAKESGGWAIGDLGVHLLDLMRACAGDASAVEASLTSHKFHFKTEDLAVLHLRYKNGAIGLMDCSTGVASPGPRLEIYGTEGWIAGALFGELIHGNAKGKRRALKAGAANPYVAQAEDFQRAMTGGALRVKAEDGLATIRLVEAARKSAAGGRLVSLS